MEHGIVGPSWDLSTEYASVDAPELEADLAALGELLDEIAGVNPTLIAALPNARELRIEDAADAIAAAQHIYRLSECAIRLLRNPLTYANCLLSVDTRDDGAQALQGRLQKYQKRYGDLLDRTSFYLDFQPGHNDAGWRQAIEAFGATD